MRQFFLLFFLLISFPCWGRSETIKIGVILPLTGDMAFAGEDVRNGFILAKEQHTSSGYEYKLTFEDNALDLGKTASAAQKLLNIDQVDVIVSLWPPAANVVAPMAEREKVVHYTIAWDPAIAKKHRYTLSHQSMVDSHVRETLNLLQKKGFKRAVFFQLNEAGFNIGTEAMLAEARNYGIEFVDKIIFNPTQKDFRTEIAKVSKKNPDVYLIWAVYPETEILIKQLREQKIATPVTGFFDVVQNYDLIEGVTFVSEISATDNFQEIYRKRFNTEFKMKAPNAFDIFNLLASSLESAGKVKPSAEELVSKLKKVRDYQGAVGIVSIDQHGNSEYPAVWHKVEKGKIKVLR